MRLAKLKEFRRLYYTPDSAPSLTTLRRNIERIVGGRKENGLYYIDLDEFDRAHGVARKLEARIDHLTKSPELEGLI